MAGERVLVVEDEYLIRLFIAEALGDEGFSVIEAGSGAEALALIERGEAFDLLLTDFQMPGRLTGIDVARAARQRQPDVPVIYITGRSESLAGVTVGARDAFVAKPFGSSDIVAALRRLLAATEG